MTENMKKFLEALSKQDKAFSEKVNNADKAGVIAMAKELGITLTDEDFAKPKEEEGEISLHEADAAAGGKKCYCAVGGGGEPGDNDETCWCVAVGTGDGFPRWHGWCDPTEIERCICIGGGYGESYD